MKKSKSIISIATAIAAAIFTLVGCDKETVPVNPGQDAVVAVFKNGSIDYWRQIATTVTSECEARGVKPIISYVNDASPLKDTYKAYVGTDNAAAGKELAAKTAGSKSIVISYAIGGSSDRADGVIIGKGAENVQVFKCNTVASAVENLKSCLESNPSVYESLILTSGNFVTSELMDIAAEAGLSVKWASFNLGATKPEGYKVNSIEL